MLNTEQLEPILAAVRVTFCITRVSLTEIVNPRQICFFCCFRKWFTARVIIDIFIFRISVFIVNDAFTSGLVIRFRTKYGN